MRYLCVALMLTAVSVTAAPMKPPADPGTEPRTDVLTVDAQKNCVFLTSAANREEAIVRTKLATDQMYEVTVSGQAFLSQNRGKAADSLAGVVVFYCAARPDGFATQYQVLKPGDVLRFRSPKKNQKSRDRFLSAFFLDVRPESPNRGSYKVSIRQITEDEPDAEADSSTPLTAPLNPDLFALNLTFGDDPGIGKYDGATGKRDDHWNLIRVGTREAVGLKRIDGIQDDVIAEISDHDGGWGIKGHAGIFHGYIYHNCQCVDLSVTLKYLPAGVYEFYVFAHGDAPNQNAAIEIACGDVVYSGRRTLNDGSWKFRDLNLADGNQYVRYMVEVPAGAKIVVTSKRDGSGYSMFNALQVKQIATFPSGT